MIFVSFTNLYKQNQKESSLLCLAPVTVFRLNHIFVYIKIFLLLIPLYE